MCDTTHLFLRHGSFIRVDGRFTASRTKEAVDAEHAVRNIHICNMTRSYVGHDSFARVTHTHKHKFPLSLCLSLSLSVLRSLLSLLLLVFFSHVFIVNPKTIKDPIKRNKTNNSFAPRDDLKIMQEIICTGEFGILSSQQNQ